MEFDIPIWLYYGGEVIKDPKIGYSYSDVDPVIIWATPNFGYAELIDKIYEVTNWDRSEMSLKLRARYSAGKGDGQCFMLVPIDSDSSLRSVLLRTLHPSCGWNIVELYIDQTRLPNTTRVVIESPRPTRTLKPSAESHARISNTIRDTSTTPTELVSSEYEQVHPTPFPQNILVADIAMEDFDNAIVNNDLVEEEEDEVRGLEDDDEEIVVEALVVDANVDVSVNNACMLPSQDTSAAMRGSQSSEWMSRATVHEHGQSSIGSSNLDVLFIGQRFPSKDALQHQVKMYAVKNHREFVTVKSDRCLYHVKCKYAPIHHSAEQIAENPSLQNEVGCPWRLRAIVPKGRNYFVVKKLEGVHTCVNPTLTQDHSKIDLTVVSMIIMDTLKEQLSITPRAIIGQVKGRLQYTISYWKAWKAKHKAIEKLYGSFETAYTKLSYLLNAIQASNPGTAVHWAKIMTGPGIETFKGVFWAFGPSIEGFKSCRPVISVDGTHLYGKYKGCLLIAVSPDANGRLFPFTFALVEGESIETWTWFMNCIQCFVTDREGLCVISDRHAGILSAMGNEFGTWREPFAYHRYCMRHFASNFHKNFGSKFLMNKLKVIACQNQWKKYEEKMAQLEASNADAANWVKEKAIEKWALTADGGRRYGIMTTNLSEVFNSVLKGIRSLLVTAIVEQIFFRLNMYFTDRREAAQTLIAEGKLWAPRIQDLIDVRREKSNLHEAIMFNNRDGIFGVKTGIRMDGGYQKGGHWHTVDLEGRTCTCGKFQLFHVPCSHVLAACASRALDYQPYIDPFYSTDSLAKTWAPSFNPIPDESYWPTQSAPVLIVDSSLRRVKERPKSSPIRNDMDAREGGSSGKVCSKCGVSGHNRRSCKNVQSVGTSQSIRT